MGADDTSRADLGEPTASESTRGASVCAYDEKLKADLRVYAGVGAVLFLILLVFCSPMAAVVFLLVAVLNLALFSEWVLEMALPNAVIIAILIAILNPVWEKATQKHRPAAPPPVVAREGWRIPPLRQ